MKGESMTALVDEISKDTAESIARKLPNMERYSFDTDETEYIYELAGSDLLTVSQLRTLVMLMAQKIMKDVK
jgi:hypothetical protein